MLGSAPRPGIWHLPIVFSLAAFSVGSIAVVLISWLNSVFRVSEDCVILSVIGLVVLTAVLEFA
jgi:hypothetical protein